MGGAEAVTLDQRRCGALREVLPEARIVCTQLTRACSGNLPVGASEHLSRAFALGAADGCCCGGSVVVALDGQGGVEPGLNAHEEFIRSHVETPLCLPACNGEAGGTDPEVGGLGEAVVHLGLTQS